MAKTANVNARMEPELKKQAEGILEALGIPASNAVTMFYKQIVIHKGLPFDVKLPDRPLNFNNMSEKEIDMELEKGYMEIANGLGLPAHQVFQEIKEKYDG